MKIIYDDLGRISEVKFDENDDQKTCCEMMTNVIKESFETQKEIRKMICESQKEAYLAACKSQENINKTAIQANLMAFSFSINKQAEGSVKAIE